MQPYRFMEVSMACTNVQAMEDFWTGMFDGKVLFRGLMAGQPFSRMIACGVTLVFREDPAMAVPPGPGQEVQYRNHLGIRVDDLEAAIAELEAKGARFTMTPALVREWQKKQDPATGAYLQTTYIAPPLSRERITSGEYRHDVAIFPGPDNLWIELNEVHEPHDAQWFPA
jgi:catechol 2,3-dioxygenase-like lactoylglutathione lyase family enzyme